MTSRNSLRKERQHKTSAYLDAVALNRKLAAYARQELVPELQEYWDGKGVVRDETKEQEQETQTSD